jgi:hypothetical protein
MDVMHTKTFTSKKIRFPILWSLVFSFLLFSCSQKKKENNAVTIEWEGNKAKRIIVPLELLSGTPQDSIEKLLHIQLANTNAPMLGDYIITNDAVTFQPLIAFTRGLKYEIHFAGKLLAIVEIPTDPLHAVPELLSIYPTGDTLPLNLLKVYLEFSKPMQEGQALENIVVTKNNRDTVPSVFLDLQPELWNKERTILTLWLDPGRIKRDLQPNKEIGLPLELGATYQIINKSGWRDAEGDSLFNRYLKEFYVGSRDSISPNPDTWTIHLPKAGSKQKLKIDLHEPLDYMLLKNAIRVFDNTGKVVNAVIEIEAGETIVYFIPSIEWSAGNYTLEIESRLEDLAGNNLNRLFDKDLTKKTNTTQKDIYKRVFTVR